MIAGKKHTTGQPGALKNKGRILIADEDKQLRDLLSEKLKTAGYFVTAATNGTGVLEAVREGCIDIVLLGDLPKDSGKESAGEIRGVSSEIEIIILTSHASLLDVIAALRQSASDFFIKPVDYNQLQKSIVKSLNDINAAREKERLLLSFQKRFARGKKGRGRE